ncbi:MerR family DNA-binding transcriptional regulator, partial [candidate division WWE3 bacterium]|nr:MerR family DNA-binding transcriptional regulator [candidate division WWE3 bacterium]
MSEAAKILGISPSTLRRFESEGKIKSIRKPNGYRAFKPTEVYKLKTAKDTRTPQKITPGKPAVRGKTNTDALKLKNKLQEYDLVTKNINNSLKWTAVATALLMTLSGINPLQAAKLKSGFSQFRANVLRELNIEDERVAVRATNVLGARERLSNFVFNVNVPTNLGADVNIEGDLTIEGELFVPTINQVTAIDLVTKETLEETLEIGGDFAGTLTNVTLAPGSVEGPALAEELTYEGTLNIEGILQAAGDEGSGGQLLSSTGDGVEWIDPDDDADTLDGIDSAAFLRSNISDTYSSGTLDFSDGTLLDLSAIQHNDTAVQGLLLPQATSFTAPTTGEGYIAYDTDDNGVYYYNGTSWTSMSSSLQGAYDTGSTIQMTATAGDIQIYNDSTDQILFIDEDTARVGIGATSPAYKLDVTGSVNIASGYDLYIEGEALRTTALGDRQYTDDAFVIDGQTFTASIDALDQQVEDLTLGTAGLWTDAGSLIYLVDTTDDFVLGGSTLANSIFSIDESAGVFLFGGDNSADPTLRFEATDSSSGNFGFNANDAFHITNANLGIGTTNPVYALDVNGDFNTTSFYIGGVEVTSTPTELNILEGALISTTELNLLSGRTGVLVDSNNVAAYATTAVDSGSGLTGGGTVGSLTVDVGAGSGISVSADAVALGPLTATWNQTGEFDIFLNNASSELSILESAGATYKGTIDVGDLTADRTYTFPDEDGVVLVDSSAPLELANWDQDVTDDQTGTGANGQVAFWTGTYSQSGSDAMFWDNGNSSLGIGTTSPSSYLDIRAATTSRPSLSVASGSTPTSPSAGDIYADGTNIYWYNGSSWDDLTSGGGGLFTDLGATTYLTAVGDNLAIGGSSPSNSIFGAEVTSGNFYFASNNSYNPVLNFEATDSDSGILGFNTSDSFYISGASLGVGTTSPTDELHVAGNILATTGFHVGTDSTNTLIDDDSNGSGSTTLYIGNETILASGDIGSTVQGYNANTTILGSTIEGTEILGNTIEETNLEATNSPTDNYSLTYDLSTGGFTWVDPTTFGALDGSGTADYLTKWTDSNTVTSSVLYETGGSIGIGTTNPTDTLHVVGSLFATTGFHVGSDATGSLIDDASNGSGSTTLYIGDESILTSGDIGTSVQGYNANTTVLGSTIEGSEITNDTIEEIDLEITNSPTDDYILSYDLATGGFTWVTNDGGSGASKWTDSGTFTYLTGTTDDLVLGDTDTTDSPFLFDVSTSDIILGGASTGNGFETTIDVTDPTADRTIVLPDAGGEFSLLGQSISSSEITDDEIVEADLSLTNGAVAGYILSYDSGGGFTWVTNDGGSGASKWTDSGTITYLTDTADDLAVGGSTTGASIFGIDEDTGTFYFASDNSANPSLVFEATDSDSGTLGFNTNDSFYFSGANVGIGTTAPASELDVSGDITGSGSLALNGAAINAGRIVNIDNTQDGNPAYSIFNTVESSEGGGNKYAMFNDLILTDPTGSNDIYGILTSARNTGSSSNTIYSSYLLDGNSTGGTHYGYYVDIDDPDSTNYSVYVENGSGISYFGSSVGIGASTPSDNLHVVGNVLATTGFHVGADATGNLIDDASNGSGSTTLYIGDESILTSGDIGASVQGYNANTTILGSTIEGSEIANDTIEEVDLEITNSPTDNYSLTYDLSTGGFTWVDPATFGSLDGSGIANYITKWSDSDTLAASVIYETGGNLGIGTTNPSETLHVIGDFLASDNLFVGTNSETLSNTGFVVNGDDLFVAGMAGVEGNIYTDGSFIAGASTSYGNGSISQSSGETLTIGTTSALLSLTTTTAGDIQLNPGGTGNVAIGTGSDAFLDIKAATLNDAQINLTSSLGTDVSAPVSGDFWWNGTNLYFYNGSGNTDLLAGGGTFDGTGVSNYIAKFSDADTLATSVIYELGGNLGIGTTAPASKLEVAGTFTATTSVSTPLLSLSGTGTINGLDAVDSTTENTIESLIFDTDTENITGVWELQDNVAFNLGNEADFTIMYDETTNDEFQISDGTNSFFTLSDQGTTAIATINGDDIYVESTGNVGIGTTDPTEALHVNGDIRIEGGELYFDPLATSSSTTEGTVYYDDDVDHLYLYGGDNAFHRVALDMTKYTGTDTTVPNQSYVQIAHGQGTNDISVVGWFYNTITSLWEKITDKSSTVEHDSDSEFSPEFSQKLKTESVDLSLKGDGFGDGSDGAITVSSNTNINDVDLISGRNCADGGDAINYNATALTSNTVTLSTTPDSGCLAVGDEILIINLQGTSSYVNVGNFETKTIQSISTNVLTFTNNKTRYYGDGESDDTNIGTAAGNQRVMIQRVPNYTTVTVNVSQNLYPDDWDGTKGGVMFFRATGAVSVSGNIHADAKGYRGGAWAGSWNGGYGGEAFCGTNAGGMGGYYTGTPDADDGDDGVCGGGGGGGGAGANGY